MFKVSNEILYQILDLGERLYSVPDPQSQRNNNISTYSSLLYAKHCCKWIDYLS